MVLSGDERGDGGKELDGVGNFGHGVGFRKGCGSLMPGFVGSIRDFLGRGGSG